MATTVTSSLFELYSGLLRGFEAMFQYRDHGYSSVRVRGGLRGGGGVVVFLLLSYILLSITKFLSHLVRLFISRQREFRADAIAVRLTRDPVSLAEALYTIKYKWRGAGLPAQELEAIFIANPAYSPLDESEGTWANLFSTHPPMAARLGILLDMAHSDAESLVQRVEQKNSNPRVAVPQTVSSQNRWVILKEGKWEGPYALSEMTAFHWFKSETWVQRLGDSQVQMAYQDPDIYSVLTGKGLNSRKSAYLCPRCVVSLNSVSYEGREVFKCPLCQGTLVGEKDIQRLIIREEVGFSDRVINMAEVINDEDRRGVFKEIRRDPTLLYQCPQCRHPKARMTRMFYTEAYRVEVDKCFTCGLIWFDQDELEIIQCLIESAAAHGQKNYKHN